MNSLSKLKHPSIETLRALAVVLVFIHHLHSIANITLPYIAHFGGWVGFQIRFSARQLDLDHRVGLVFCCIFMCGPFQETSSWYYLAVHDVFIRLDILGLVVLHVSGDDGAWIEIFLCQ